MLKTNYMITINYIIRYLYNLDNSSFYSKIEIYFVYLQFFLKVNLNGIPGNGKIQIKK